MRDRTHGLGRDRGQIDSTRPLLFDVDLLQREYVGVQEAHALAQAIQIDSTAHGASVQDVEGRHSHDYLYPQSCATRSTRVVGLAYSSEKNRCDGSSPSGRPISVPLVIGLVRSTDDGSFTWAQSVTMVRSMIFQVSSRFSYLSR